MLCCNETRPFLSKRMGGSPDKIKPCNLLVPFFQCKQRKQEAAQNKARFLAQYHQPVRPAKNRDEEKVKDYTRIGAVTFDDVSRGLHFVSHDKMATPTSIKIPHST